MTDIVDLAGEIAERELARRISAARAPLAEGLPGECENCGGTSPRLVQGWCARCRDRRRR